MSIIITASWTAFASAQSEIETKPLVIGQTFHLQSDVLRESRRINVYLPAGYGDSLNQRFPVLYMPDGGLAEDFLHVAGLLQVLTANGTMRPFILVGIENTERRRDLTGPTSNQDDLKVAKVVGKSSEFRKFIRDELMPHVKQKYRTTNETAIIGESFAGLFVVESFLLEPDLFDTYIAIDPSLWWNNQKMVSSTGELVKTISNLNRILYLAQSSEEKIDGLMNRLVHSLKDSAPPTVGWHFKALPDETHATVYHPAALAAFRTLFKPSSNGPQPN